MHQSSESSSVSGGSSTPAPFAGAAAAASASGTMTVTEENTGSSPNNEEVLQLTLQARPSVRWDENVVDNEGLGKKSSKRCCIFHKQRAFGESSTDSSDEESAGSSDDEDRGSKKPKKIARPKKGDKPPDFQRFHA